MTRCDKHVIHLHSSIQGFVEEEEERFCVYVCGILFSSL